MEKLFISYRHDDSAGYVMALRKEMNQAFGAQNVFIDVEDIPVGSDFVKVIEDTLGRCIALLVTIGPLWLRAADSLGQRRLDDPRDFVRLEIATAILLGIPVIPVLVGGAEVPGESDLPMDIKPLARMQGIVLSTARWDEDVGKLCQALERLPDLKQSRLYQQALDFLGDGNWERALQTFETIRPGYQDVAARIQPLRELSRAIVPLGPATRGWRRGMFRRPLFTLILLSILPNLLTALFNFFYNWQMIVIPLRERGVEQAENLYQFSAIVVNGSLFPLGMGYFIYLSIPVVRAWRQMQSGSMDETARLGPLRNRCVKLADYAAIITAVLWTLGGPVYPALIGALSALDYVYFIASLFLCGVIAATYSFLAVAWLSTRMLYLQLIRPGSTTAEDEAGLDHLGRSCWRYLLIAGTSPLLAITLELSLRPLTDANGHASWLGLLGVFGIVGFVLAIQLFRSIQSDLAVLRQVTRQSRPYSLSDSPS